jgi:cytochrome c biogenesis protein CcmG/thiol:disulfide interchange protein DsbE
MTSRSADSATRLTTWGVAALVLAIVWTFLSRVPDAPVRAAAPPPSPKEGFSAPPFSLASLDDGMMALADVRGQPVVLNLWASWCLPCKAEMPALERVYQRYRPEGLVVLGINMTLQDSPQAAEAFVRQQGLTFPILLDADGSVQLAYHLLGLPSTFFVDRSGVIRSVVVGGPMSEATISAHVEDLMGRY